MILYKYTRVKYLENILKGSLAFPSFKKLNDPFESSIESAYNHLMHEYKIYPLVEAKSMIYGQISNITNEKFKGSPLIISKKFPNNGIDDEIALNYNKYIKQLYEYFNYCKTNLGILSLTSDPENILMWTHYADNGKGVCVGIDFNKSFFNKLTKPDSWINKDKEDIFKLDNIIYKRRFPKYRNDSPSEYVKKAFFTKYKCWSYEQEYRLLRPLDSKKNISFYEFPIDSIKVIYLGINYKEKKMRFQIY